MLGRTSSFQLPVDAAARLQFVLLEAQDVSKQRSAAGALAEEKHREMEPHATLPVDATMTLLQSYKLYNVSSQLLYLYLLAVHGEETSTETENTPS